MSQNENGDAVTLSISLARELSEAVSECAESGRYSSPSELIGEAVRRLLHEQGRESIDAEAKLAMTASLMEEGRGMHEWLIGQFEPDLSEKNLPDRRLEHPSLGDLGSGLRVSPERLAKLLIDEAD